VLQLGDEGAIAFSPSPVVFRSEQAVEAFAAELRDYVRLSRVVALQERNLLEEVVDLIEKPSQEFLNQTAADIARMRDARIE
jgi:hypothetical protein